MITVNGASRILAGAWVQLIRSERRIPAIVRDAVRLFGNGIDIAPPTPRPGQHPPAWLHGLVLASRQNSWEITTAEIVSVRSLTVGASSRLVPDLPPGTESQFGYRNEDRQWQPLELMSHHEPGMSRTLYGVTVPSERMAAPLLAQQYWRRGSPTDSSGSVDDNQHRLLRHADGENRVKLVQDGVASGRGLVVIGTRTIDSLQIVTTFLHELAVHAGRFGLAVASPSIGWLHGDFTVENWTREIERLHLDRPR